MKNNNTKLKIGIMTFKILTDWSGVERVASDLAFAMVDRGHEVSVIVPAKQGKPGKSVPVMPLPEKCGVLELPLISPAEPDKAREILKNSNLDVVIAMFGGRELLWAPWLLSGSDIPLLIAESINPQVMTFERWNPYEHYAALMAADYIQVLLPPYKEQYPPALQSRIEVIGNPSPPKADIDFTARKEKKEFTLLSVGRFEERTKQITLLLRAWALLYPEFPQWSLTLVGDGPQNDLYRAMGKAMGGGSRVKFTGSVGDVGPYYADSDILCMPSKNEGFGLVLTEAASYALPLVGLESCEAAKELISSDIGILAKPDSSGADTPATLAEALRKLMSLSQEERINMGKSAQNELGEKYAPQLIYDKWEELIIKTALKKGKTQLSSLTDDRWNTALLGESIMELISRTHPLDQAGDNDGTEASIIARLQSERDTLKRDYDKLSKKYSSLLNQLKGGSRRKR